MFEEMRNRIEMIRLLKSSYKYHVTSSTISNTSKKSIIRSSSIFCEEQGTTFSTTPTSSLVQITFDSLTNLFQVPEVAFHPMITISRYMFK
jgi:hypothetical protein